MKRVVDKYVDSGILSGWMYTLGVYMVITLISLLLLFIPGIGELGDNLTDIIVLLLIYLPFGMVVAVISTYIFTPLILRISVARPPTEKHHNMLSEIQKYLEEISLKSGIKAPQIMIVDTPEANAMAYMSILGNKVAITRGLIDAYSEGFITDGELFAVLAHEIAHIRNLDPLRSELVLSWVRIFDIIGYVYILISQIIFHIGRFLLNSSKRQEYSGVGCMIQMLLLMFGWIFLLSGLMARLFAKIVSIISFHHMRQLEYNADREAAYIANARDMISVLRKMDKWNEGVDDEETQELPESNRWQVKPRNISWIDRIFDTHPAVEDRAAALTVILGH